MKEYLTQFLGVETKIGLLSLILFLVFYALHNFYKNSLIDLIGTLVYVPKEKEARVFNLIYYLLIFIFFVIALLVSAFSFGFTDTQSESSNGVIENINTEGNVSITSGTNIAINIISTGLELDTGGKEKPVISGIEITESFLTTYDVEIKEALTEFKITKDFEAALEKLKELRDKSQKNIDPVSAEGLRSLITASLYTQNKNIDGILDICTNYYKNNFNANDYLFDIHAHLRSIAIRENHDKAFEAYETLKADCVGGDISPVWIGIPLGKMEDLKRGSGIHSGKFGRVRIGKQDRETLEYVLSNFAEDKHIPYALYFLEKFDVLFENYPKSSLVEIAKLTQINDSSLSIEEQYARLKDYIGIYGLNRNSSRVVSRLTVTAGKSMYLPWKARVESLGISFEIHADNFSKNFVNSIESEIYRNENDWKEEPKFSITDLKKTLEDYQKNYRQYTSKKILLIHSYLLGVLGEVQEYLVLPMPDELRSETYETFAIGISIYCKNGAKTEELGGIVKDVSTIRKRLGNSSFPGSCYERYAFGLGENFDPKLVELRNSINLDDRINTAFFKGVSKALAQDSSTINQFLGALGNTIDIHELRYVSAITNALIEAGLLSELEELYIGTRSEERVAKIYYESFDKMLLIYSLQEILSFVENSESTALLFLQDEDVMSVIDRNYAFKLISLWGRDSYSGSLIKNLFVEFLDLLINGELEQASKKYQQVKLYLSNYQIPVPVKFEKIYESGMAAIELSAKFEHNLKSFRSSVGKRTFLRKATMMDTGKAAELVNALTELHILTRCVSENSGDNVCSYLRGVFYKKSDFPLMAEKDFNQYLKTGGRFTDDALAELGLIYLEHYKDIDKAKIYFKKVYIEHANHNAADNALYWLGEYFSDQNDLRRAYNYYFKVATTYSSNRLSDYANSRIDEFIAFKNGEQNLRKLKSIRELKYEIDKDNFVIEKVLSDSQFAVGDIVMQIEGIELSSLNSYSQVLIDFSQVGGKVQVLISREGNEMLVAAEVERGGLRGHLYSTIKTVKFKESSTVLDDN
jgi:hypothetical protein